MATTAEDLIVKIKDLKLILDNDVSRSPGDPFNAKDIADNIKLLCEEILPSSSDFSYFLSLLFSSDENGLFFVVKQLLKKPEFDDVLCICLDSFTLMMIKAEAYAQPYVSDIVALCLKVIKQESLKAKREYGYNLLISTLELAGTAGFENEQLHIEEIIKFLHSQLETIKRSDNNSVKKGLFQLIGVLSKQFPQQLENYRRNIAPSLASVLTAEIKNNIGSSARSPHYGVLEGCFLGFDGFLYSFHDVLIDPSAKINLRQLYDYCKIAIDPDNNLSRHAPQKAALSLLINHSYLFKDYFFAEYKVLYKYFQTWAVHSDRDLRNLGFKGIDTLLLRISEMLPERLTSNLTEGQHMYKFFVDQFSHAMVNSVGVRETAIAVKGLGYFAEATKILHSQQGLLKLLRDITTRSENVFLNSPEPMEQKITYVPQFLEAAANALMCLDEVSSDVWIPLETIHSLLYQYFPLLDKKYFLPAISASCRLFVASCARNNAYLDHVVRQFLLRLFSLVPVSIAQTFDVDNSIQNRDPKNFTYKDYLPLWSMLLGKDRIKEVDEAYLTDLRAQIFDGLISICIDMMSRLDLEAQKISIDDEDKSEEFNPSSQPLQNLQPKKQNDFCIFINMVDFLRDLLTLLKSKLFEKWISTFIRVIVKFSTKYPLVSGFYKLLTLALSLGNDLNYFKDVQGDNSSEYSQILDLVLRFIDEILIRLRQFKDDLLVSCLQLILKIPPAFVHKSIRSLSEAIKVALKLGLTYLPLAENCMDALELWDTVVPVDDLRPLYNEILPSLDDYLNSEQVVEPDYASNEIVTEKSISRRKRKKGFDKKKAVEQKMFAKSKEAITISETKLTSVRVRMLLYIGRLGGQINHWLIDRNQQQLAELCTSWDTVEHLTFGTPFPDMKPNIVLDKFLPRLCTLAVSSGDRKAKVAACESLHSIVLYTLGKNSQQNEHQKQKYPMHHIYRRLFPVLLQLCCDADEVPKELFRLLTNQIIHWFTSNRSYENTETIALLDSLLEAAESSKDANIRDYAAQCVNEFLKWSIKHSTESNKSPIENNVLSLFKRLCSLASHASSSKRLAASLLFNAIYRTFREETSLVGKYLFELLAVYLNSLALASHDDESEGTVELCVEVIGHLERIVKKTHEIFLKRDDKRLVPVGWQESTMEYCVRWLFDQIGRTPMMFRQKCIELFETLSRLVITFGGPKQYFTSIVKKNGIEYLIDRFEGAANSCFESGISRCPTLELKDDLKFTEILRWFDCLLAALDCYFVSLNDSLIESDTLFSGNNIKHLKLFTSCTHFLDMIVGKDFNEIFNNTIILTPRELKLFNKSKCTVFVRLLQFYTSLLNKSSESLLKNLPKFVWPKSLFLQCLTCCFDPMSLGFDLTMKETVINLPTVLHHWITAVSHRSPPNVKKQFSETLSTLINGAYKFPSLIELLAMDSTNAKVDWFFAENIVKAYSLLNTCNVLPKNCCPEGSELWRNFVEVSVVDSDEYSFPREWSPAALNFAKSYLKFASELGIKSTDVAIALLDSTAVKLNQSSAMPNSLITRGSTLMSHFDESITLIAAKNPDSFLSSLISINDRESFGEILCRILGLFIKDSKIRHSFGEKFVKITVEKCQQLFYNWASTGANDQLKFLWVSTVQKLAVIHSSIFTKITSDSDKFFDCFLRLLTDKTTNLNFKTKVLGLLGVFGESRTDERDAGLRKTLNDFVIREFPFKSTEFTKGSQECDDYLTAIRRMVIGLSICHNPIILEVLINLLCRESEHVAEEEITTLLKAYSRSVNIAQYDTVISVPYNLFWNENGDYSDEHRLNVLEKLLLPMLNGLDLKLLKQFFLSRLTNLISILDRPFGQISDVAYRNQLISKYGCFNLLELVYSRLDVSVLKGELNEKFVGKTSDDKTELLKKIIVLSQDARKEGRSDSTMASLKWRYRCSAHNCLVAVLMATQTKAAFFERYVFKDVWDCIIDSEKKYSFDIDVGFFPNKQKQILSTQRISTNEDDDDKDDEMKYRFSSNNNLQYLSSQFLADSSLRSELTNFDFTGSLVSSSIQSYENRNSGSNESVLYQQKSQTPTQNSNVEESSFEMEMDELNKHPCMKITISVVKFLVNKNITPIDPNNPGEMPAWMRALLKQLETGDINTKLFVARVITLLDEIFAPFAKPFLMPLIRLILDPDCGPVGLHLFRIDSLVTLLRWANVAVPEKTDLFKLTCCELLEYLMAHVMSSNRAILRRNIKVVNWFLELWKDCFIVESDLLFKYLVNVEKNEVEYAVGLQLLGVFLGNNVNPLGRSADATKIENLFRVICYHLNHKSIRIYKVAAEVAGLALKFFSAQKEDVAKFETKLEESLSKLLQQGSGGRSKFLECLQAVQLHYSKLAQRFMKDVLNLLSSTQGHYKAYCLEIILGQAKDIPDLFDQLNAKGLTTLLVIRDESRQLLTLNILKEIVDKLKFNNIRDIQSALFAFSDHPNRECRLAATEIYCRLYDLWSNEETENAIVVTDLCRECLLKLLNDSDQEIRLNVYNFWSHETRLSADTAKRLSKILSTIYNSNTERDFLSHATYLLLELASKSPDFKKEIFDKPLTDCKFEDFNVVTSWRRRFSSLQTPAFADSQVHSAFIGTQNSNMQNQLRATLATGATQFTQTQISGKSYDWMTGGSYNTLAVDSFADGSGVQNGDDLAGLFPETKDKFKHIRNFGLNRLTRTNASGSDSKEGNDSDKLLRQLNRRILKDRQKEGYFYARMQTQRQQLREKKTELLKNKREQQVSLYRKYRVGDFPDVQIPHSAIITPLQAVAKHDPIIAGYLFESLMSAIYDTVRKEQSDAAINDTTKSLIEGIETILNSTVIYYRPLISSLLLFCYNNVDCIRVDAVELKNSATMSRQQQLGIVLMEKMLMFGDEIEKKPPEKRVRKTRTVLDNEQEVTIWIELMKLYKSLEDRENVRAIFSRHLNSKEETKLALELENRGEMQEAVKIYTKALIQYDSLDESPSILEQAESDCWQESRLQCLNDLNQWKDLADVTERSIDSGGNPPDISKVWQEQYLQNFYLPFLLRSKLKLVICGNLEHKSIIDFVQTSLSDPDKKLFLQEQHAFNLALIDFMKRDYQKTNYECNNVLKKLLKEWASLTHVDLIAKKHVLQETQRLSEMMYFLKFQDQKVTDAQLDSFLALMENWISHSPSVISDSINVWDDVLMLRTLFVEEMCERFSSMGLSKKRVREETYSREIRIRLQYAESATVQRNFDVAFSQLDSAKEMLNFLRPDSNRSKLTSDYCRLYAETQFLYSDIVHSKEEHAKRLLSVLELCEKFETKSKLTIDQSRHLLLKARTFEKLGSLFYKSNSVLTDLSDFVVGKMKTSVSPDTPSIAWKHPAGVFFSSAFNLFKSSCSVGPETSHTLLQPVVDFCDSILRNVENGLNETCTTEQIDIDAHVKCFVETLLKSMSLGSFDSRRMFPRLLQILEHFPNSAQLFMKLSDDVPDWMFLGWLNQIVAVLDTSYGVHLNRIIEKIADNYPQALVYPLMLSREGFKFSNENRKQEEFVNRIEKKMAQIPLVKDFVDNLVLLSHPSALVKDTYSELIDLLKEKNTINDLKLRLERLYNDLLLLDYDEKCLGNLWKNYIEKVKEKFDKFGKRFAKFINCSSQDSNKMLKEFESILSSLSNQLPVTLKDYSIWLAEFSNENYGNTLEIPGQYTGDRKPIPNHHVYIHGFDSQVKVYSSLRRPKSIIIRGNDGKEYKFIVKSGEDLRQDQRIQQIFHQMNGILAKDYQCNAKAASLKTYAVIPLTTKVGLIEVIPNVDGLKEFLEKFKSEDDKKIHTRYIIEHIYGNKFFGNSDLNDVYGSAYKGYFSSYTKFDHNKAADCFLKAQQAAPKHVLRNGILRLCSSPEAFYVLRNRFSISHAALCVAHYLLGIGDRHLSNFMIDTTSAMMVGIDFGYVFGTSVQLLHIPELMPFRLTKQITDVFEPVGVHGLVENVMCYCMRAFRENAKLLVNTMDVFIKEPALNWLKEALLEARYKNIELTKLDDLTWHRRQKIDTVICKLNGDNPVSVIEQELRQARTNQTISSMKFPLDKVIEVIYGSNKIDKEKPRGYPKHDLSVEDQIACLIDMATDPVILARVYYGWEPWI